MSPLPFRVRPALGAALCSLLLGHVGAGCRSPADADRGASGAGSGAAVPPPSAPQLAPPAALLVAPLLEVADTTLTATRCVVPSSCAAVSLTMPRLALRPGLPTADSAALAPVVRALGDSLRVLAGLPLGDPLQGAVDRQRDRLFRELRAAGRRMTDWGMGFSSQTTVRVRWQSTRVLTVELETTAFTGGAHGDYAATLRSYDLRTGAPVPVTAMVRDTAALVPMLEAGFVRAKADSGGAAPPLRELLYPEVKRLPVSGHVGIVADGIRFLYNPYEVASWAVGRTDVLLTWEQLGALAARTSWGG